MAGIIGLKNISFSGQNVSVIHDISLDIEEGKTTALAGASGCGKSTLLKLCAGILIPTGGDVYYKNQNISNMSHQQLMEFRKESAFVFQDSALWSNQSLYQNMELPLRIHYPGLSGRERRKRIQAAIDEVGYKRNLDLRPAALSAGEQKLIGFARAMICGPRIMFLDEWTESLDDNAANRLIGLVKERQEDNNTIVFVSHNLKVIKSLAQHIVMLDGGRINIKLTAEQISKDHDLAGILEKGIT